MVGQAYSADHLILQDLDTQNNLATICQDDGSLCSDVEVVNFDDLDSDKKDQVIEMIASSPMDGDSYNSTPELDQFSNFLSHSDEIFYSLVRGSTLAMGTLGFFTGYLTMSLIRSSHSVPFGKTHYVIMVKSFLLGSIGLFFTKTMIDMIRQLRD